MESVKLTDLHPRTLIRLSEIGDGGQLDGTFDIEAEHLRRALEDDATYAANLFRPVALLGGDAIVPLEV